MRTLLIGLDAYMYVPFGELVGILPPGFLHGTQLLGVRP